MKNNVNVKKAFTLVELIVVITILAILWTIAFLSMQWYSADARNSKRVSDLNSISNAVNVWITNGTSIIAYVNGSGSALTGISIAWTWATVWSDYSAWPINYSTLWIKQADFQDPSSNTPYVLWATTKIGWKYEVASIKETWTTKSAIILWNYVPRIITSSAVTWLSATAWSWTSTLTLWSSDLNKLFLSDTVVAWTNIWKITIVSSDLSKITFDVTATSTGVKLANAESTWLIGANWSLTNPVVNGWWTYLPY